MSFISKKKGILIFLLSAVLVLIMIFLFRNFHKRELARNAAGTYIIAGGESFLILESDMLGGLKIKDGGFHPSYRSTPLLKDLRAVSIANGKLKISQDETFESYSYDHWGETVLRRVIFEIECVPGKSILGDWDVADAEIRIVETGGKGVFSKNFWNDLTSSSSVSDIKDNLSRHFKKNYVGFYKWDFRENSGGSILHRVDDPRVARYFQMRRDGNIDDQTLEIARELARDHPGDPYLELHRVEMEALRGNPEDARELFKKWEESHASFPDLLLKKLSGRVSRTISIEIAGKKYPDWRNPMDIFQLDVSNKMNMNETLEYYKRFLSWELLYFISFPMTPPINVSGYTEPPIINFLDAQVQSKALRVMATLSLFQGKREESLETFASIYRMGQALNSHGSFIQRLIGIAIRAIAAEGLRIFVLNACESEEEFQNLWAALERLHNTPGQEEGGNLLDEEFPLIFSNMKWISGIMFPNMLEAETRHKVSDMKFQLVRMACAAKRGLLVSGDFPSKKEDFDHFLPEGILRDSFTENVPLKITRLSPNEMAVYSVGPDRVDDFATIPYDPTNGTISKGDIFVTIPRKREFPFPREAVRAANAYELLEKFPNGLPADPFADTKGLPFSVIESTEEHPLVIMSFGPNTDENRSYPSSGHFPFAAGDSGMDFVSRAGAVNEMEFQPGMIPSSVETPTPTPTPTATPSPTPIATPDPGPHPSYGRSLQKVFIRSDRPSSSRAHRFLEPPYDPTNGTVSAGDLFIEIPR